MHTRLFPQDVNYREDGEGPWKPIDLDLASAGGGTVEPAAVDGELQIPSSLVSPVVLERDGSRLEVRLIGGTGSRTVSGEKATFADALPGVDAVYAARTDGVKETVQLKTAAAAAGTELRYSIHADAGLSASVSGDQVTFRDASGDAVFRVDAPLAWDSAPSPSHSNAIDLQLEQTEPGKWILTVAPDAAWLNDPARVPPISVDPDYYWVGNESTTRFHGADLDCMIQSGTAANNSYCASTLLGTGVGYGRTYKSLLRFDVSKAIPAGSTASSAILRAYANTGNYNATLTRVRTVTSSWDSAVTWNKRNATTTWTTPSGDVSTDPALIGAPAYVAEGSNWYEWAAPVAAVQGWISGTLPNNGLQLAADPGATNLYTYISTEGDQASWPALDIVWEAPDTTAPTPPTGLGFSDLDSENFTAVFTAVSGTDPANGNQKVSGVARTEARYKIGSGAFGAWQTVGAEGLLVSNLSSGNAVSFEARTVDVAGNASTATAGTFTATIAGPDEGANAMANAAFAQQFGVTEATAATWLAVQGQAADLRDHLEASTAASSFASMWLDNVARKVHVNSLSASADAQFMSQAQADGIAASVIIDRVTTGLPALQSAVRSVETSLADIIAAGRLRMTTTESSDKIVFTVASTATTAEQTRIQTAYNNATVPKLLVQDPAVSLASDNFACEYRKDSRNSDNYGDDKITQCDLPARGGVSISRPASSNDANRCTAGFVVKSKTSSNKYILSVGHCLVAGGNGAAWFQDDVGTRAGVVPTAVLGNINLNQVSNNDTGFAGDAGLIPISIPATRDAAKNIIFARQDPTKRVKRNPSYRITGTSGSSAGSGSGRNSIPGDFICLSGARTGGHCGRVKAITTNNLTAGILSICGVKEGDSGGPVYDLKHKARGLVMGTLKGKPCDLVFNSALVAEEQLGVTILNDSSQ